MKARIKYLATFFITLTATFMLMKVAFILYNSGDDTPGLGDILSILAHGLPQDLTTASYMSVVPWLACIISIWYNPDRLRKTLNVYTCIIVPLLVIMHVADCALYEFWQFKLDATIFNYIDDPKNIAASISWLYITIGLLCIAVPSYIILRILLRRRGRNFPKCTGRLKTLALFLLTGGCMFLMIRGGVGRSTMNIGKVYYSPNQFYNHAAVNPAFSLIYSSLKHRDFDKLYHYFSEEECERNFAELHYSTQSIPADTLLNTKRPNIVLIMMEGLGAQFVETLGGEKGITPNLNRLSREGVLFTNCYANSFRTDRGTVSTLSGYPAFPDLSVMKLPEKSRSLPSIAKSLSEAGYTTSYLYGGDKNFTNANSYLLSTGYDKVTGDEHFPATARNTHSWGVTDHIVLDTLCNRILQQPADRPFFITCQTLSSHEDWQVPYDRIAGNPKANAMAYLDDCIGKLADRLRNSHAWKNLLLIFIPDHSIRYPDGITACDRRMSHIPLIWAGGATARPRTITQICNQSDLAATLLGQLGIGHPEFTFSRDVTSTTYSHPCAIYTFGRGVSFIDSTGITVEDLNSQRMLKDGPSPSPQRAKYAHTLLQRAVLDLARR